MGKKADDCFSSWIQFPRLGCGRFSQARNLDPSGVNGGLRDPEDPPDVFNIAIAKVDFHNADLRMIGQSIRQTIGAVDMVNANYVADAVRLLLNH
jgi:hypothetical protein